MMNSRTNTYFLPGLFFLSAGAALFLVTAGSRHEASARAATETKSGAASSLSDKPLAAFQRELLEIAARAATALPKAPHLKNRSRAQESVVEACLELDQPLRALGEIEKIDNWRRGVGYADLAFYRAQHADTANVQHDLDLACEVAERSANEGDQDWSKDRIRALIAKTHVWLGQTREAAPFEAGVVDSEIGKVEAVKAMFVQSDDFDDRIASLKSSVAAGNFDQVHNALECCAELFDRFYDDAKRRSEAEEAIKRAWKKLPIMIRIDLTTELIGFALAHEDLDKGLALVEEAERIVDGAQWTTEARVPLIARLAALRHGSGDPGRARQEVDAALAMYEAERAKIADVFRAGVLRPVAEAYESIGDSATALVIYERAVEEGVGNPNSRPRAEDLSATCRSMALHAVAPDESLRSRMLEICEQLGPPW